MGGNQCLIICWSTMPVSVLEQRTMQCLQLHGSIRNKTELCCSIRSTESESIYTDLCACAIDCVTVNKMAELAGAVVFFRERAYARRKGGPGKIRSGSRDYADSA